MIRVLILGGCGYIGGAVYKYLKEQIDIGELNGYGIRTPLYDVDTVDLEWFGNYVNPRNIKQDYRTLSKEFLQRYDVVILLAAYSSPAICANSGATAVIANNVINFSHILPKLHEHQKFIYASSITVYAGVDGKELDEDTRLIIQPVNNLYDFSKQDCDRIVQEHPTVQFYGLRLATVCGISNNWRNDIMINAMTDNALSTSEIKVFNPLNTKPILHVNDLCRAIEAIMDSPKDNRGFYNLASYNGVTEEIAEVVAQVTHSTLRHLSASEMANSKLPATTYDLSVSTKKFEQTFEFKFKGDTTTITEQIVKGIDDVHKSKRIDGIKYGL